MDSALLIEYAWALIIIVLLEGLLAADNALVMAVMVKHLPEEDTKKALFYGLGGAFIFRFASLFIISFVIDFWEIQAIGATYLIMLAINHLYRKYLNNTLNHEITALDSKQERTGPSLWGTIFRIELADIAFAVDSILAAMALVLSLPSTRLPNIGGMDGAQFLVAFIGGFTGLIFVRFAATYIIVLLRQRPSLETTAYLIVGWVGIKLACLALAHPVLNILPAELPHSYIFKLIFWSVLLLIAIGGWLISREKSAPPLN